MVWHNAVSELQDVSVHLTTAAINYEPCSRMMDVDFKNFHASFIYMNATGTPNSAICQVLKHPKSLKC